MALSKLTVRLYGQGTWPFETKKEKSQYFYRANTQIAEWWLAAVGTETGDA